MKTEASTRQSMDARYVQLKAAVAVAMDVLGRTEMPEDVPTGDMRALRKAVGEINQCFHEFSAYRNALVTD